MNTLALHTKAALSGAALALSLSAGNVLAADLPDGFEINKDTIDANLANTYHGHTIKDMLTEKVEWQVREQNLRIYLAPPVVNKLDPEFERLKEVNATKVTFDPASRSVSGWEAGMPFPNIDPADPQCGDKFAWNLFYGSPIGTDMWAPTWVYLLVDGNKGLERLQGWTLYRYFVKGRWGTDQLTLGDPELFHKTLIFAREPFDIKGLGIFALKYDSPKLEDNWAYIRSFRRVRRLSGGAWMDPIGGTDQLADDVEVFNAHPTWYPTYKCVGKRTILATTNARANRWIESETDPVKRFPTVSLGEAPYWHPVNDWSPVEVMVVEAETPPEHPYSKKVMYLNIPYGRALLGETYDRKGEFWKFINFQERVLEPGIKSSTWAGDRTGDDHYSMTSTQGHIIDYQRRHATIFVTEPSFINRAGVKEDEVSLQVLESAAAR